MSLKYDEYIDEHKYNVYRAFRWLKKNDVLKDFSEEVLQIALWLCESKHDETKRDEEEYDAYDKYFYGGNKSYAVVNNFNYAWLHHIHANPHHWQHWVLINDDLDKAEIVLDMPDEYIIEMICDWMSFSFKKGDINELFSFYESRSNYMKLSDVTRKKVEDILDKIRIKSSECDLNDED